MHLAHDPARPRGHPAGRRRRRWRYRTATLDRFALAVVAIVLAPISEEIIFRGILYPTVKRLGYPRLALWGVALLFAAIHASLPIFLPLFLLAVALTLLYEKTGNLLAPIAAHALFNALNFAMFFLANDSSPRLPIH